MDAAKTARQARRRLTKSPADHGISSDGSETGDPRKHVRTRPPASGAQSMRRTKASLFYRSTRNLSAVQLLLGDTKLESTARPLAIEVDDPLILAEHVDI